MADSLFAGIRVRDYQGALAWYQRLLGEPSMHPNDEETVWEIAEGRFIYIVADEQGDGGALATVFCDDLDASVERVRGCGVHPAATETYANGVRKVIYRDPEGNEIGFGGAPTA